MQCRFPVVIYRGAQRDLVRCGKCLGCRITRREYWTGRMLLESSSHASSRFVTLTYPREVLADDASLDYAELQSWLRNMRRSHGKFRFFAVGEYGDLRGRGHWHVMMFGAKYDLGLWPNGGPFWPYRYDVRDCGLQSIRYIAKYCCKNMRDSRAPIARMSLRPGIGLAPFYKWGTQAASLPIPGWPLKYQIGDRWYPIRAAALAHFQSGYLDAGGRPPASSGPDERNMRALVFLHDEGTRIEYSRLQRLEEIESGDDRHAISHTKKSNLA